MKKTIKRTIILTEVLVLAGLATLMLFIGIGDLRTLSWENSSRATIGDLVEEPAPEEFDPSDLEGIDVALDDPAVSQGFGSEETEVSPDPASSDLAASIPTPTVIECGPPADWVLYQIEAGDSLSVLAEQTGAALADLQKANCLGYSTLVAPGMEIFLPGFPVQPTIATPVPTVEPTPQIVPTQSKQPATVLPTTEPTAAFSEPSVVGRSTAGWVEVIPERVNGYVERPGTGWQYYWSTPVERTYQTVAYGERDKMSWNILNPAEGVYNWAPIDNQMAAAVQDGYQFSFRVYTNDETHTVPQWALNAGVKILSNGDIDYSDCVFQEKWGKFVNALVNRYDGNPNISFIDISGYSDYNEWAWEGQTEWDYVWANRYAAGTASASTMSTMDSYTRRRLADMFIGGSFQGHQCTLSGGGTKTVNYSYPGFQQTQLVLPSAGIVQSTQYVFLRRPDVGFRHDGLGREVSNHIYDELWKELSVIWRHAPVILETISPNEFVYNYAKSQIIELHGSIVHNPKISLTNAQIVDLIGFAGYRYALLGARYESQVAAGDRLDVEMGWRNIGSTPAYPKMGQTFTMYLYLTDLSDSIVKSYKVAANVASWIPNHGSKDIARGTETNGSMLVPPNLPAGQYKLKVAIIHDWSGEPIGLDANLNEVNGLYELGRVTITAP